MFRAHDEEMNAAVVHAVPAVDGQVRVLMRDEKEGRKKQARSNKYVRNKAKQHNTPKAVTFPEKNDLPRG